MAQAAEICSGLGALAGRTARHSAKADCESLKVVCRMPEPRTNLSPAPNVEGCIEAVMTLSSTLSDLLFRVLLPVL